MNEQFIIIKVPIRLKGAVATVDDAYKGYACEVAHVAPGQVYENPSDALGVIAGMTLLTGGMWLCWQVGSSEPYHEQVP